MLQSLPDVLGFQAAHLRAAHVQPKAAEVDHGPCEGAVHARLHEADVKGGDASPARTPGDFVLELREASHPAVETAHEQVSQTIEPLRCPRPGKLAAHASRQEDATVLADLPKLRIKPQATPAAAPWSRPGAQGPPGSKAMDAVRSPLIGEQRRATRKPSRAASPPGDQPAPRSPGRDQPAKPGAIADSFAEGEAIRNLMNQTDDYAQPPAVKRQPNFIAEPTQLESAQHAGDRRPQARTGRGLEWPCSRSVVPPAELASLPELPPPPKGRAANIPKKPPGLPRQVLSPNLEDLTDEDDDDDDDGDELPSRPGPPSRARKVTRTATPSSPATRFRTPLVDKQAQYLTVGGAADLDPGVLDEAAPVTGSRRPAVSDGQVALGAMHCMRLLCDLGQRTAKRKAGAIATIEENVRRVVETKRDHVTAGMGKKRATLAGDITSSIKIITHNDGLLNTAIKSQLEVLATIVARRKLAQEAYDKDCAAIVDEGRRTIQTIFDEGRRAVAALTKTHVENMTAIERSYEARKESALGVAKDFTRAFQDIFAC